MLKRINIFKGINNKDAPHIIADNQCTSSKNLLLNHPIGTLTNSGIGSSKWNNVGVSSAIMALAQLKKHGYTSVEDTLFYWEGGNVSYGFPYYSWTTYSISPSLTYSCFFDSNTEYLYFLDSRSSTSSRIGKYNINDASDLTYYGSYGDSGVIGTFSFNQASKIYLNKTTDNFYVSTATTLHDEIKMFQLDGSWSNWTILSNPYHNTPSANAQLLRAFYYEPTEDYIHGISSLGGVPDTATLFKCKIDGSDLSAFTLTSVTGVTDLKYDVDTQYYYISNYTLTKIIKTQWNNANRTDFSTTVQCYGSVYNPDLNTTYVFFTNDSKLFHEIDFTSILKSVFTSGTGENQITATYKGAYYEDGYIYIPDNTRLIRIGVNIFE